MNQLLIVAVDLVAIAVLAFGIYHPRYHRRDLAVAFLGVNVGVLAVSLVLAQTTVGAGLGLGLFGVLSIIRLRSTEISQHEVAYYFAALAIGLVAGLGGLSTISVGLMALLLAVLAVVDHPALLRRTRQQTLLLDTAHLDEAGLRAHLEAMLGGRVTNLTVRHVDLVDDTTLVDVRYLAANAGKPTADAADAGQVEAREQVVAR